jgi:YesN/AraC family two-component response regulator
MQEISILVVEDDAITLEYLCSTLAFKYPDMNILKAFDGMEGMEIFEANSPQLVITDLNMPGMDGKQMASRIRSIKPDTRFIALTGFMENEAWEESEGAEVHFDHYIVKPVIIQELFSTIDQCIKSDQST